MRSILLNTGFFVLLICVIAACESYVRACPVRVEVMDVVTGRYINGAKVTAQDDVTDEKFRSVINAGLPYFKDLQGRSYSFTATAPGYKKTLSSWITLFCSDRFPGHDAVIQSVYMWKGSPSETVRIEFSTFTPPPYKGKYGVRAPVLVDENAPSARNSVRLATKEEMETARISASSSPSEKAADIKTIDPAGAPPVPAEPAIPERARPPRPEMISGGVLNGKATVLPKPVYPRAAREKKAQGAVSVMVVVDEEGNVIEANAVTGHELLREAAVDAAWKAKFSPTKLSGEPIKVKGVIVYNFVP